jgi:hypothetical protein
VSTASGTSRLRSFPPHIRRLAIGLLFVALAAVWLAVEFIDSPQDERVLGQTGDIYAYVLPMTEYAFASLREGRLPLWNPYQLCGMPFLATYVVGVFYPPHLLYLLVDPALGLEILVVLHLALAGLGAAGLARILGAGPLGSLAAGITFMWSGTMAWLASVPPIQLVFCWMPITLLCIERMIRGLRWAFIGLALTVAMQNLGGHPQFVVHNMLAAAAFALVRLGSLACSEGPGMAIRRGLELLACVAAGLLLAAPQLLPTLELAQRSERAPGSLGAGLPGPGGALAAASSVLRGNRAVLLGTLPWLALGLGIGARRLRLPFWFALGLGTLAILLVSGGPLYAAWVATPVGGLFRAAGRFLTLLALAAALLAAVTVTRLEDWLALTRRALWSRPAWWAGLALAAAWLGWILSEGERPPWLGAVFALLLIYGAVSGPALRRTVLLAIVVCQGAQLFLAPEQRSPRPIVHPDIFERQAAFLDELGRRAGLERTFLSRRYVLKPSLTLKQGMLRRIHTISDYDPLIPARHSRVIRRLSGRLPNDMTGGMLSLGPKANWTWLDLMSTRFFVVPFGSHELQHLLEASRKPDPDVRLASLEHPPPAGSAAVFESEAALPRAYFVPRARVLSNPAAVLRTIEAPAFEPRSEVVLELAAGATPPEVGNARGSVEILGYEPERVELVVESDGPGLVVLTDSFFPGWRARAGDRELPIHRANFLFRAVAVEAGRSRIVFEYRPKSVRLGLALGAAAAAGLIAAALRMRSIGPRRPAATE